MPIEAVQVDLNALNVCEAHKILGTQKSKESLSKIGIPQIVVTTTVNSTVVSAVALF